MQSSHACASNRDHRKRRPERGTVVGDEQARLARTFGAVLAAERIGARLTQAQLAKRAGLSRMTITFLECGRRRPTIGTTWRLVKALRPDYSLRVQVALDLRLQQTAGDSLRSYSRKQRLRRARVVAALLAESADGVPVTEEIGRAHV